MDTGVHLKLSALNGALDDLETELEPLLAQTLPETVVGLETLQQAKLQVSLPYLVYDLVFIYLRTKGIDPKTHPVIAELDRIRQYFDKLKNAEDSAKRTVAVDKDAANRFIKHAIAQAKAQRPPGDKERPTHIRFNEDSDAREPVKVTSKLLAREQYQRELREENGAVSSDEGDALEIIDDSGDAADVDLTAVTPDSRKGKDMAVDSDVVDDTDVRKRRRPSMDPSTGSGDDPAEATQSTASLKKSKTTTEDNGSSAGPDSGSDNAALAAKGAKKAAKKAKKAKRKESAR